MSASEEKCDKLNASGETGSRRLDILGEKGGRLSDIPGETGSRRLDGSRKKGSKISAPEGKGKSMESISGWLIHMLGEISPSLLESEAEIPECDLAAAFTEGLTGEYRELYEGTQVVEDRSGMPSEPSAEHAEPVTESTRFVRRERRPHSNWKLVVAASGLAAACSAAVTGIVVFVCMKRSASYN
ncbi:MAG: hypothetical protein LUF35_09845 [Lachnospiraceae bacterium]|nr:hypothetical protein [Lachnospiraceae bacterium]